MTRYERRVLTSIRRNRDNPPTDWGLFRQQLHLWALWGAVLAAVALYFWRVRERPEFAIFLVGMFAGVLADRIKMYSHIARAWPITASVIDYEKVDARLADGSATPPPTG